MWERRYDAVTTFSGATSRWRRALPAKPTVVKSSISESVRDAIDGLPDIELCEPCEVELKGFQGWHSLYPVKVPH